MGIQTRGKSHSIKITLGYHPVTGQRLYYTETFKVKKQDARLREAELKLQHSRKKLVVPSGMTLRECFDLYLDEARPHLSPVTHHHYESSIERYILPSLGDKELRKLDKDDFQKVYDLMTARGLSPHTIHTLHDAVRAVIRMALDKRMLSEDIRNGIKLPKLPKPQPEFLSYEEMQLFFDAASDYWYGNAFKFQFVTGERNQELMALMWEDIDFKTARVRIRRACC